MKIKSDKYQIKSLNKNKLSACQTTTVQSINDSNNNYFHTKPLINCCTSASIKLSAGANESLLVCALK